MPTLVYFKKGNDQIQIKTDHVPQVGQYVEVYTNQEHYINAQIGQISCNYVMSGNVKEVSYTFERYTDQTHIYVTIELQ